MASRRSRSMYDSPHRCVFALMLNGMLPDDVLGFTLGAGMNLCLTDCD